MNLYVFASNDKLNLDDFNSLISFDEKYDSWFEVFLASEYELLVLFSLLGLNKFKEVNLEGSEEFVKLYNYSGYALPEYDENQFNVFYEEWITKTGRESSMDEYGQLIFIQGYASKWNKNANRIVLQNKL